MGIKKIFIFLSFFLIFSLNTIEKTEAGLKDEYKITSDCDWFSAQYDAYKYIQPLNSNLKKRYCITSDKKVITVLSGTSCVGSMCFDYPKVGKSILLKGKIGASESFQGTNVFGRIQYYISEWDVEGDKLILYQCPTEILSGKCSGKTTKAIKGTHRSITNPGLYINDVGSYYRYKGNYDKSMEWYTKAIDMNKELDSQWVGVAYLNRGLLKLDGLGNSRGACSDFRKADNFSFATESMLPGLIKEAC